MARPWIRLRFVCLAAGVALVLAAPAGAAEGASGLQEAMRRLVAMPGGPPGVAVTLQRGGRPRFHTAGVAQLGTSRRWKADDHMRLASVSKAFSGAVALSLVAAGRLGLDQTVGSVLRGLPAAWNGITLGQLLNHTSGLPDFSRDEAFIKHLLGHLRGYIAPRRLLAYVEDQPLSFRPGSRYAYSNTDNVVVALMAAAVGGETYSQVLRQRVTGPLGLTGTTLPVGFRIPSPFVHGYDVDPPAAPEDVSTLLGMSSSWASGGITSTAGDLNRFIRGYVGGALFDPTVQAQQLRFVAGRSEPPGPGANAAGLAVFSYRTRCGTVYGHTGNTPGYTQFMAASEGGERSVVVSINAQITAGAKNPAVRRAFRALRRLEERAVCAALVGR